MVVDLSPQVDKYIKKLHEPIKSRINKALDKLEGNPPQGDISPLAGQDGYRLRVGKYRLLFDIFEQVIIVHTIDLRGQVYKKR